MTKKKIVISLCTITLTFFTGWKIAKMTSNNHEFKTINQAIPVVRFEHFYESRNVMIIGLFNPGEVAMEINHTELFYQKNKPRPQRNS